MRTLLLASLTISALQNPAEACGGSYAIEPTVYQLASYFVPGYRHADGERARSFALLGEAPTGTPAWRHLSPGTFDNSQIADAEPLATPTTLTLVGPSGARVVTSKDRALIKGRLTRSKPTVAVEVDMNAGQFVVALAGKHTNAKWISFDTETRSSKADVDWVTARGVTQYRYGGDYVHIRKLQNTNYEVITTGSITFVRSAGKEITRFDGRAIGGLSLNGQSYVLKLDGHGVVTPIWI